MIKTLGAVVGGLFVGAVVMEIIHKKYPNSLEKFYSAAGDLVDGMKEGFKDGYQSMTQSEEPAEA